MVVLYCFLFYLFQERSSSHWKQGMCTIFFVLGVGKFSYFSLIRIMKIYCKFGNMTTYVLKTLVYINENITFFLKQETKRKKDN